MVNTFRRAQWLGLGITAFAGILAITYYLIIIPQTLTILNTDVIVITAPIEGAKYIIGDEIEVTIVFDPSIIGEEATGYNLIVSSPDEVLFQENATNLSYTTRFTLTRDFILNSPTESLTIRAEITIDSKTYYNELDITVIDS